MIDSLIILLQRLKTIRMAGVLVSFGLLAVLLVDILLLWNGFVSLPFGDMIWEGIVLFGLFVILQVLLLISVLKLRKQKEQSYFRLYAVYLPVMLASEVLVASFFDTGSVLTNFGDTMGWFLSGMDLQWWPWLLIALSLVYPTLILLKGVFTKNEETQTYLQSGKLSSLFLNYNIVYYGLLAVASCFDVFDRGSSQRSFAINSQWGVLAFIVFIFFFSFPFITMRELYKKGGWRFSRVAWGVLSLIVVLFATSIVPRQLENYSDNLIQESERIVSEGGENYETYKKASKLGLAQAYQRYFNKSKYVNNNHFNKIFDATPESYFGNKLSDVDSDGWNRGGTNATQVGKEASVLLKLLEMSNTIMQTGTELPIMKTTYQFHVNNETDLNQEFIVYFQSPSSQSVVSDLKLGLNGEMQGVVASRGAARRVYEDAIRTNRDPALIEKVGANSYSLRVFPVPSKLDKTSQGRQLVQVTMLTPLTSNQPISYSPKFSFINLKTTNNSALISKIYKGLELIREESKKDKDMDSFLSSSHTLDEGSTSSGVYCLPKELILSLAGQTNNNDNPSNSNDSNGNTNSKIDYRQLMALLSGEDASKSKISLFFDNSLSVERNKISAQYTQIYNSIKNFGGKPHDVDLFSFNFSVEKIASVNGIRFWGYSDTNAILNYIEQNNLKDQHIIIITDDDSFTLTTQENTDRNIKKLHSNTIDVLFVGEGIKRYPSDFTTMISATQGNVFPIGKQTDLSGVLSELMKERQSVVMCPETMEHSAEYKKIAAGVISNVLLGMIEDNQTRSTVAQLQNAFATRYQIVNQFNAMIALQTDQEKRDLEQYEQEDDRFDTRLDLNGTSEGENPEIGWPEEANQGGANLEELLNQFDDSQRNTMREESAMSIYDSVGSDQYFAPTDSYNTFSKSSSDIGIGVVRSGGYDDYNSGEINAGFWTILGMAFIYIMQLYQILVTLYMFFRKKAERTEDDISVRV